VKKFIALPILFCLLAVPAFAGGAPAHPNVIFFLIDDMGSGDLS
jgi:hypothetical protein